MLGETSFLRRVDDILGGLYLRLLASIAKCNLLLRVVLQTSASFKIWHCNLHIPDFWSIEKPSPYNCTLTHRWPPVQTENHTDTVAHEHAERKAQRQKQQLTNQAATNQLHGSGDITGATSRTKKTDTKKKNVQYSGSGVIC